MGTPKSVVRLALLAAMSHAGVAGGADSPAVTAGDVELFLSPHAVSALPIDIEAALEALCIPPKWIGPRGECRLTVTNTPGGHNMPATVSDIRESDTNPFVAWQPADLNLSGTAPVVTSCGTWNVSLTLDPTEPQPTSPIFLRPTERDPERGLAAGVLVLNALLSASNPATGQDLSYPLAIGLGLAGPWSLAPTDTGLATGKLSNLLLLDEDGSILCLPVELLEIPAYLEMYENGDCKLCVEAVSSSG